MKSWLSVLLFFVGYFEAISYVLVYKPPSISLFTDYIQSHTQTYTHTYIHIYLYIRIHTWIVYVYITYTHASIQIDGNKLVQELCRASFSAFIFLYCSFHTMFRSVCALFFFFIFLLAYFTEFLTSNKIVSVNLWMRRNV